MVASRSFSIRSFKVAAIAFVLQLSTPGLAQQTTCFASLQGGDRLFGHPLGEDADAIIKRIQLQLESGSPGQGESRAHLYAILADAYYVKGEVISARRAAISGTAAITANDGEPLRHRLSLSGIYYLGEIGQLAKAADEYEAAAELVPGNAPDLACVLEIRGYMRMRNGRIVDAANDLVRAARLAKERGSDRYRIDAEAVLSLLYANYGLFEEAHALVSAALAESQRAHDEIDMANAYFRRGDVYLLQGDLASAEPAFRLSGELSRLNGQPSVAVQADERLCTTLAGTTRYQEARTACQAAIRETTSAKDAESTALAYAALGQIELGDHHQRLAQVYLNRALGGNGTEVPPRENARFHKLRGQARELLGDTVGALEDTNAYVAWTEADGARRKIAQMAMARAKADAAIQDEKMGRVRAQADAAELTATRAHLIVNIVILAFALLLSIVLSGWWLWRRRLAIARVERAAAERFATIGQLTAGIAHEFNNQLTIFELGLGALAGRSATGMDPTARMLIRSLQQATEKSASITAQLRSFGRQQNLQPRNIELESLFSRIGPLLDKVAGNRVRVRLETASPPPAIYADEALLTEALKNLVSNARDAMSEGGVVRILAEPAAGPFTTIKVTDQGAGMPADVLLRATEPFFTTKQVGNGTGLGLSMVEGFATQSGGSMSITSILHQGTTVVLQLPRGNSSP